MIKNKNLDYSVILLILFILLYVIFFSILSINRHQRFNSLAYDLGIYDQKVWLLANGGTFNTVRGLHIFGDHLTFILVFLAPLYWIWSDVRFILIFQTLILALGAIPTHLLAKKLFSNKFIPLIFVFSYLIYPALHFINLEDFHPESIAVPFFLFSFYFLKTNKTKPFLISTLFMLLIKEELALIVIAFGIYSFLATRNKKSGLFLILSGLTWLILATYVFFPNFVPEGYLYKGYLFGEYGETPKAAINKIANTDIIEKKLYTKENLIYTIKVFTPVLFIPIFVPSLFIFGIIFLINILISWSYAHSIEYHYIALVIPFIFISTVYGLSKIKNKNILKFCLSLLVISSITSNIFFAPEYSNIKNFKSTTQLIKNFNIKNSEEVKIQNMINIIPKNASISASYIYVPHLSHRKLIFNYPNPFRSHYWGNYKDEPPKILVDYILILKSDYEQDNYIKELVKNKIYNVFLESNSSILLKKNIPN